MQIASTTPIASRSFSISKKLFGIFVIVLVGVSVCVLIIPCTLLYLLGFTSYRLLEISESQSTKFNAREIFAYPKRLFKSLMQRYKVLNFMVVGGIGYAINMAVYYPLTLVFKNDVTFLGQHFYLPPFILSSLIAITCNYFMNKRWTFGDRKSANLSYLRYLSMALITLLLDIVLLFVFVDYGHLYPMVAAALAIAIAFISRYGIANFWIWRKRQ